MEEKKRHEDKSEKRSGEIEKLLSRREVIQVPLMS
jgi:hypothetical protein